MDWAGTQGWRGYDGVAFGHLLAEDVGEADDGGGGFGEALRVVGVRLGGLMDERAVGGAGGDVGQRMRGVRGVDEVALQHHVRLNPTQRYVVWSERAEYGFEVVDVFRESGVFECGADAGGVEGDFDGGGAFDGEAEAAGGVVCWWRVYIRPIAARWMGHPEVWGGCGEHIHRLGGRRFDFGLGIGFGGDLLGDGAGVFEDGDGETEKRRLFVVRCSLSVDGLASGSKQGGDFGFRGVEVVVDGSVVGGGG